MKNYISIYVLPMAMTSGSIGIQKCELDVNVAIATRWLRRRAICPSAFGKSCLGDCVLHHRQLRP